MEIFSTIVLFMKALMFIMETLKEGRAEGKTVAETLHVFRKLRDDRIKKARAAGAAPHDDSVLDPYDRSPAGRED